MRIAVISDTHMDQPTGWFLRLFEEELLAADVLVHCGDITGLGTWNLLLAHPRPVVARGNCDWLPALARGVEEFPTLSIPGFHPGGEPFTLAACHGWGPRSTVGERAAAHFGPGWDLVCYGHTHQRHFSTTHGVPLLNPGSLGESRSWAMVGVEPGGEPECEFRTVPG
ncbi:MAG: metallophosphoesterase [Desulfovibrionaceae bacterium]